MANDRALRHDDSIKDQLVRFAEETQTILNNKEDEPEALAHHFAMRDGVRADFSVATTNTSKPTLKIVFADNRTNLQIEFSVRCKKGAETPFYYNATAKILHEGTNNNPVKTAEMMERSQNIFDSATALNKKCTPVKITENMQGGYRELSLGYH